MFTFPLNWIRSGNRKFFDRDRGGGGLGRVSRKKNFVPLRLSNNLHNFHECCEYGLNKNYYDGIFFKNFIIYSHINHFLQSDIFIFSIIFKIITFALFMCE